MTDHYRENFGNKYTLLDQIGSGGMAEVFKGRLSGAEGFEKCVVIKKLIGSLSKDPEIVSHFISEARLAALLQHENIAQTYDFGELDGSYFMAMEYLAGKDLHTTLQKARDLSIPVGLPHALFITARICEGMEYAHSLRDSQQNPLRIIHRDLSPHNIFITYQGKVKIIDFGIARADLFDNRTRAGMAKGKISYMSPEQLTADKIDHRSDIFSIGILLYEMLCGKRMYSGDTATVIRKCMQAEYEKPAILRPGLPQDISLIVEKALQKDANRRYLSCAAMLSDVEECLFNLEKRPGPHLLEDFMDRLFAGEITEEKIQTATEATARMHLQHKAARETSTADLPRDSVERSPTTEAQQRDEPADDEKTQVVLPASPAVSSEKVRGVVKKRPPFHIFKYLLATGGMAMGIASIGMIAFISQIDSGKDEDPKDNLQHSVMADRKGEAPIAFSRTVNQHPAQIEVSTLLGEAEKILNSNNSTASDLEKALVLYNQVQQKEPDNPEARAGITRANEQHRKETELAIKTASFPQATKNSGSGFFQSPKDNHFVSLQEIFTAQRQKTIQALAEKAQQALNTNNVTSPADDCALAYYRQMLELDPQNETAQQGMVRIADIFAELAEAAYCDMEFPQARKYVQQGLAVAPRHKILLGLEEDLQRSKPGLFFTSITRKVRSRF